MKGMAWIFAAMSAMCLMGGIAVLTVFTIKENPTEELERSEVTWEEI